jgi:hypothetical protein
MCTPKLIAIRCQQHQTNATHCTFFTTGLEVEERDAESRVDGRYELFELVVDDCKFLLDAGSAAIGFLWTLGTDVGVTGMG